MDETIQSIYAQTYKDYELIIVDDGSTDGITQEKLQNYQPLKGVTVLINKTNKGPSYARNRGMEIARGEYIFTWDSEDTFVPTYLEKAVYVLKTHAHIGVVSCYFNSYGDRIGEDSAPAPNHISVMLSNGILGTCLFRQVCWQQAGGYDEDMQGYGDWEFWIRVLACGWKAHTIPEYLFNYRVRKEGQFLTKGRPRDRIIRTYIYSKHRTRYQKYFWQTIMILLFQKPYLLKNIPYQLVLTTKDRLHPMLYLALRTLYGYIIRPAYMGLRYLYTRFKP